MNVFLVRQDQGLKFSSSYFALVTSVSVCAQDFSPEVERFQMDISFVVFPPCASVLSGSAHPSGPAQVKFHYGQKASPAMLSRQAGQIPPALGLSLHDERWPQSRSGVGGVAGTPIHF